MNIDLLGLDEPYEPMTVSSYDQTTQQLIRDLVPNYHSLNSSVKERIQDVIAIILAAKDIRMVQSYSRLGLLEETPLLRSHIWKLLLESLPIDHRQCKEHKRNNYQTYLKLLEGEGHLDTDLLEISVSKFDVDLWDQIMLDSRRTHSMMNFFQAEVNEIRIYSNKPTKHFDILTRILYIWAKVNSGVRYVQGMNEILAPLYYLEFQVIKKESESQVFFMFSSLITSVIDMHIQDMDKSEQGIGGRIQTLNKYLKAVDYELWAKLDEEKVNPQYYSFRWLALLLSQQFGLYETMKIWDVLLSYDGNNRFKYLYTICIVMIRKRREYILESQFTYILPKLQKMKDLEVSEIMDSASKLYQKLSKVQDLDRLLERQEKARHEKQQRKQTEKILDYKTLKKAAGNMLNNLINKK